MAQGRHVGHGRDRLRHRGRRAPRPSHCRSTSSCRRSQRPRAGALGVRGNDRRRADRGRRRGRRAAQARAGAQDLQPRPVLLRHGRPARPPDLGGRQRPHRQLARGARRLQAEPAARHRRRHLPAHLGAAAPRAAAADERRSLALSGDDVRAGRPRARARRDGARRAADRRRAAPAAGRSATPTARSWRRGRCSRSTPASTGTGRCRRCSSGCSAPAASRWRRARHSARWATSAARRGSWPRSPSSCWRSRRR